MLSVASPHPRRVRYQSGRLGPTCCRDLVGTIAAANDVAPIKTADEVTATATIDLVISCAGNDDVGAVCPLDDVVATGAADRVLLSEAGLERPGGGRKERRLQPARLRRGQDCDS